MWKIIKFTFPIIFLAELLITACQVEADSQTVSDSGVAPVERASPPVSYRNKKSPKMNSDDFSVGQRLYLINCVSCHGELGLGDGPAAISLDPKPQPLAVTQAGLSDGYLFWRIAEGGQGEPFHSAMPAWETVLKVEQIWQVIGYLRELGGQ